MKEIVSVFAFIAKTSATIYKEMVEEGIVYAFTASKEAKAALKRLKRECKARVKFEIDCNGGYIVVIKKLGLELHISRDGVVREADLAEQIGLIW